ncbi:MAG TPA: NUDIX hydrolase [Candidatus Omnitrophota bacterium]|nr:NUDIX hydrolase [Candidatus Omnitrophota bacterium]HPS20963.1 NUDIX hydrolase [Candidatus Omnitrophota bacterium]
MKMISEKILFEGEWIVFKESIFKAKHGGLIKWESVSRRRPVTGLAIIAKMVPSNRYILIKQFRPAINNYVLGLPAGISDKGIEHALVELKEETGYTGKITYVSPMLKSNTGIINEDSHTVLVEVDENDPANQNPVQNLEDAEDIEVVLVAKKDIKELFRTEMAKGTAIGSGLWYLFGLEI